MKTKNPCLDCKNRYPACQSHCQEGITYQTERKAENERIKAERMKDSSVDRYKKEVIYETKRKVGLI